VPSNFSHTLRSLEERHTGTWALLPALVLLGAWCSWMGLAQVDVYSSATHSRLEVHRSASRASAQQSGRITLLGAQLGASVVEGQVLAELDSSVERMALAIESAALEALATKGEALRAQLGAEAERRKYRQRVDEVDRRRARVVLERARVSAEHKSELALMARDLREERLNTRSEVVSAVEELDDGLLAVTHASTELERASAERDYRDKTDIARGAELTRALAELAAEELVTRARLDAARAQIERLTVRAPASGVLGSVEPVHVGDVVRAGDVIATVLPRDSVRVVAHFPPEQAIGHIAPGQSARVRFDGFPWVEFGMAEATVSHVASEPQAGAIFVELVLRAEHDSRIPVQHGLTGAVDVRTGQASPWALLCRRIGSALIRAPLLHEGPRPASAGQRIEP